MIVFDEEREYLAEFAYIQAEKQQEEEWQWTEEQIKFDSKRKPAEIRVKFFCEILGKHLCCFSTKKPSEIITIIICHPAAVNAGISCVTK